MNYLVTFTYAYSYTGNKKYLSEIVKLNCDGVLTQDNIKKIISDLSEKHVYMSPITDNEYYPDIAILNIIKLED